MTLVSTPDHFTFTTRDDPTFYFIGVSTSNSSIMKLFPLWARELGRGDVVIEGIDHELHDHAESYRQTVAQIKFVPNSLGALVTTHKIDLYEAARDMFDYLDPYSQLCGEISAISKRDEALEGYAKDPITAGLSLDAMLGEDYFSRTGGEVLCFGLGGSAVAIALHFLNKRNPGDCPRRFVVVNRSQQRRDRLKAMVERFEGDIHFELLHSDDPATNDTTMAGMPEGSVVINATGMGKDRPGSPITDRGIFPRCGVAWELNYRGELRFLHQAHKQRQDRELHVEDGWLYFLHGWTQVISQVLREEIDRSTFERLSAIAADLYTPVVEPA
jgi:shikimate 5-dehydrogenase